jgi:hypothetical protein
MAWGKKLMKRTRKLLAEGGIGGAGAFMKNLDGHYGIFTVRDDGQYAVYLMGDELGKIAGEPEVFAGIEELIDSGWAVD